MELQITTECRGVKGLRMVLLYKRYGAVVAKTNSYKQIKQKVSMLTYKDCPFIVRG